MAAWDSRHSEDASGNVSPRPLRFAIDLAEARQVSQGHMRLVFEHPGFPGALVKIINPDLIDGAGQLNERYLRKRRWRRRRVGAFLPVMRELSEFLVLRWQAPGEPWPIARTLGFAETELGLGVVVERIEGEDGGLAPTLHDMIVARRFTEAHRAPLQHLFDELARLHVCIGNMHLKNIVFTGAGGRFVGIDGLGNKALIPLAEWSKRFNALQVQRQARKTFERVRALENRVARQGREGGN